MGKWEQGARGGWLCLGRARASIEPIYEFGLSHKREGLVQYISFLSKEKKNDNVWNSSSMMRLRDTIHKKEQGHEHEDTLTIHFDTCTSSSNQKLKTIDVNSFQCRKKST